MRYIYYFDVINDYYVIKEYDTKKDGFRQHHNTIFLYHNTLVMNASQITDTLEACISALNGTKKPIIYNNKNVNPIKRDIFLYYNPCSGEIYENYI